MSDEAALLAAIRDDPDEDTPRLVYADWLDEHATTEAQRARAEFIRVQIEQARIEEQRHDDFERLPQDESRISGLRHRGNRLLERYRKVWERYLRGPAGPCRDSASPIIFRRGFPYSLSVPFSRLREVGGELFQREPITELWLAVAADDLANLIKCSWLARIKTLQLNGAPAFRTDPPDWAALADSADTFSPTKLFLQGGRVGAQDALKFADAAFPNLRSASFWNVEGGELIGRVLSGRWATQLTELTVYNSFGVEPVLPPTLPQLRRLTVWHWGVNSLAALVRGGQWAQLTHLDLFALNAGDHALATLASAKPGSLRFLRLTQGGITATGAAHLAASEALETVRSLSLRGNPLGDAGAQHLAESSYLTHLTELNLGNCRIGPAGVAALASSAKFPNLRRLILDENPIELVGAAALAESPHLRGLTHLSIRKMGGEVRSRLRERFGDRLSAS